MPQPPYRSAAEQVRQPTAEIAYSPAAVAACLPLKVQRVDTEQAETRRIAVMTTPLGQPVDGRGHERVGRGERDLASRVEAIEQKLDMILAILTDREAQQSAEQAVYLELSSDRAVFAWPETVAVGATLELELTLGLMPPKRVHCLATVEACEAADEAYRVHARFSAIRQEDVDALHRYVITSQRSRRRSEE